MAKLHDRVKKFRSGNIKNHLEDWKKITSDKNILDIVQYGLELNFIDDPPEKSPFEYPRSQRECRIMDDEVSYMLKKEIIERCCSEKGEYFSNLFTAPKKDGTYRTILNLKFLNKECNTAHFKMESLKQALHMVRPGAYLASIDIKDAFYSVAIHPSHKKYLKFMWTCDSFQFKAMPNGYADAMRVFTKLLKPVFSTLRELGYESVIYVDDSLLQGDTFNECMENVLTTLNALQDLGFVIHSGKSKFIPTQKITFLGFIVDTSKMTLTLTTEKKEKIKRMGMGLSQLSVTIRMLSRFIGNLTASFEGVPHGRLHYRHLEHCKTKALKKSRYNFDAPCLISEKGWDEINWWINNISDAFAHIKSTPSIDYTIYTDASKKFGGGWGASDNINDDINGRWSLEEQKMHINCLELKAIKLAIQAYAPLFPDRRHIRIMSDNTSAIAYINKQGGTHCMVMNDLAVAVWEYCIAMQVHISAAHIPGVHNILAHIASREFYDAAEWMLPTQKFQELVHIFGQPEIDLFASRLNNQLPIYVSWKPDPGSTYIDAMLISWSNKFVYIFPPFSMMWPVLSKLEEDRVERAIIVMPKWPTQSWYPRIMKKVMAAPLTINSNSLILPGTSKVHPLAPKLRMLAVLCSCKDTKQVL